MPYLLKLLLFPVNVCSRRAKGLTLRRSSLSPVVTEVLQVLIFIFRNDLLTFTKGLLSTDLSVIDISTEVIKGLLSAGKVGELMDLLDSSWNGWGKSKY
jgi:hypothetical protein